MIAVVDVEVMVTLVVVCLGVDGDDGCSGYMRLSLSLSFSVFFSLSL